MEARQPSAPATPPRASAAPRRRGPRCRRPRFTRGMVEVPIVGAGHDIVAWTATAPVIGNGRLRHAEAERVLGGPIFCTQIALTRADDIARAGGPPNWRGPWRCLALCPIEHARGLDQPVGDLLAGTPPAIPPPSAR